MAGKLGLGHLETLLEGLDSRNVVLTNTTLSDMAAVDIAGTLVVDGASTLTGATTQTGLLTATGGIYGGAAEVLVTQGTHTNTVTGGAAGATVTIAANTLVAGNVIHVKSFGRVTDNNSTDTLTPKLVFATADVGAGAALDVADSDLVRLDAWITIRTIGSSGTWVADGTVESDGLGATKVLFTKASTAVDTTAAVVLNMDFDWSVAHAENIYIQDQFIVNIY